MATTIKDKNASSRNVWDSHPIITDKPLMSILFIGSCKHIINRLFLPKKARESFATVSLIILHKHKTTTLPTIAVK